MLLIKWISSDFLGLKVIPSAWPQLRASCTSVYRLLQFSYKSIEIAKRAILFA